MGPTTRIEGTKLPSALIIHWKDSRNLLSTIILTDMIYYTEKIQIKISQRKRHTSILNTKLPLASPCSPAEEELAAHLADEKTEAQKCGSVLLEPAFQLTLVWIRSEE